MATVKELREALRARGLPEVGRKAELEARLAEAEAEAGGGGGARGGEAADGERRAAAPPGAAPAGGGDAVMGEVAEARELVAEVPAAAADGVGSTAPGGGAEISLSVDETNKLRAQLGLKPLREGGREDLEAAERKRHAERVGRAQKDAEGRALREKLAEFRQRRQLEEELQKTKWLGVKESEDDDDLSKWVDKSRAAERARREEERGQMQRLQKMLDDSEDEDSEGGEAGPTYTGVDLAGLKVRHGADEFEAGEGAVLTLADRGILDDRGELNEGVDELEVGLLAEEKRRAAERAKTKGQDRDQGVKDLERGVILSKYDDVAEAEARVALEIGSGGTIAKEDAKTAEEMKLNSERQQFARGKKAENLLTTAKVMEDQYTKEELGAMMQKSKKHRRKRKKEKRLTETDLDDLEKAQPKEPPTHGSGGRSLQSTAAPVAAKTTAAAKAPSVQEIKESRRRAYAQAMDVAANEDRFYKEREASAMDIERTGHPEPPAAPLGKSFVIQQVRARQGKTTALDQSNERLYTGEAFTETTEFVNTMKHNSELKNHQKQGAGPEARDPEHLVSGAGKGAPAKVGTGPGPSGESRFVDRSGEGADAAGVTPAAAYPGRSVQGVGEEPREADEAAAGTAAGPSERNLQKGLGAALEMLKSRNELKGRIEWAGRTNDKKTSKVRDVVESFQDKNRFAQDVEFALTRRDEFGRVLTPKEAFRQLCHQFHGIAPGKNKQEKKIRQYKEELQQKKAGQGDTPLRMMGSLKTAQKKNNAPYLVLSGTVKPGQSSLAQGTFSVDPEADAEPRAGGWAAAAPVAAEPPPPPAAAAAAAAGGGSGARPRVQMSLGGAPKRKPAGLPGAAGPPKRSRPA